MLRRVETPNTSQPGPIAFAILASKLDERTSVVSVEGELDLSTAPRLKEMLIDSLEAGADQMVVDLSHTTFIDSTALSVLLGVNGKLEPDAQLAVVCTRPHVLQIFEFSGTDGVFAICPTLDEALASARRRTVRPG
jgi:anti-sigma B factor antagonist